jgi:hypothetical protein
MDRAAIREADLGLLRVHVDVDLGGRQVEVHDADGISPPLEDGAIGLRHGPGERPVTHGASVDEQVERDRPGARALGRGQVRLDAQRATLGRRRLEPLPLERLTHALAPARCAEPVARGPPVAHEEERHVRSGERREEDRLAHVRGLGPRRLQELAPRRDVEEELADLHRGPFRRAGGPRGGRGSALDGDLRGLGRPTRCSGAPRLETRTCGAGRGRPCA